jgi:CRP-like cAMP-binding protein
MNIMTENDPAGQSPLLPRGSPAAEHVAELLRTTSALMGLTAEEARVVVDFMSPLKIDAGATFISEGASDDGSMLLVLDGEVVVESPTQSRAEPHSIQVLGPGHLVGEMRFLTNQPRCASCKANTDVLGVSLSQASLQVLLDRHPQVGAKLLLLVAAQMAERLRETTRKFKLFDDLTLTMQREIHNSIRARKPPDTIT